jgi:UDP-N-acetylmuramoyl-L-alanyl-D-glutamate--2,6-diaminopimelate ligase
MTLRSLIAGCRIVTLAGDPGVEVRGIAYDSRHVEPGFLFIAVRGARYDANRFVPQAISNGAVAVLSAAAAGAPPAGAAASAVPAWVRVADDREALAVVAANFYDHPTRSLHLVGVTGTNGKTTTTYVIDSILKAAGHDAAVFGTIEYRGPDFAFEAERTTPEAPDLEQLFRRVVDSGWKYSVMEVSSHAIELKRVAGLHFEVAVFTNLSRDHLDFHGDMRSYFLAKKKLFSGMRGETPRLMVLNADDANYAELRAIAPQRVISYGIQTASDIRPVSHRFGWEGTEAVFETPAGIIAVSSRLMGTPNLYNMGAAIGVAVGLGIPADAIRRGLNSLPNVPGRFELVTAGQDFRVIVDYAHTDDALDKLLKSAREITSGQLIVVFGCGGDRDRSKRPVMGEVAALGADRVVVTSDNPRSEDPLSIIHDIENGLQRAGLKPSGYLVIPDRRQAIRAAIADARGGDTVVIAGKGHETYQQIGNDTFPFDDKAVAREIIHELDAGRNH